MSDITKVLVYCHPKLIKTPKDHFHYADLIVNIPKPINNLVIETVDIKPGGNYTANGFLPGFTSKHRGEYDLVFLPDCAGLWYTAQSNGYIIEQLNDMIRDNNGTPLDPETRNDIIRDMFVQLINLKDIVVKWITGMLKPGGVLLISKFITVLPKEVLDWMGFTTVKEYLENAFRLDGWEVDDYVTEGFVAMKVTKPTHAGESKRAGAAPEPSAVGESTSEESNSRWIPLRL